MLEVFCDFERAVPLRDASRALRTMEQALESYCPEAIPQATRDVVDRSAEQLARWLLAYLLDWHRREDKAVWWEYFRLKDLPEQDLFDEGQALAGLELSHLTEVLGLSQIARRGRLAWIVR